SPAIVVVSVSMLAKDVLPVSCLAAVAAPAGRGRLATDTGRVPELEATDIGCGLSGG
ncbi:unnamed protein product, partial [marine sediment metagenome]